MNRYRYRLVFNQAKGQLVVAAELGMTRGKGGSVAAGPAGGEPPSTFFLGRLTPLCWAILVASSLACALPAQAQILPDRNAPGAQRPHVLESANGTPQVNIQTPSAQGVSRNAYRQFDVDGKGAILNNARQATQTQLGGWVQGNPNLATGEARVIVNEVNSRDPSQLRGHVEVAGRRAEVVIANPAGIHVDGAGFINASGTTLTTGRPEFSGGDLAGYRVEEGTIRIAGDGLDTRDSDYTAILARAVEVQAGVWANDLEVAAGANAISADRAEITPIAGRGEAPEVAIDVAHLGGMYAGKIHLLATERGVGVHHAGDLAASQQLTLSADGRLESRGALVSEGELHLRASRLEAGGATLAAGGLYAEADSISLRGGQLQAEEIAITAREGGLDATGGELTAQTRLALHAATGLATDGARVQSQHLDLQADTLSNRGGDIVQHGTQALRLEIAQLDNSQGRILAEQDVEITADNLDNTAGLIGSIAGELTIIADDIDNTQGRLEAQRDLTLDVAGTLANAQGEIAQLGEGDVQLSARQLQGDEGLIVSQGELAIQGEAIDLAGGLTQAERISVQAGSLSHHGGEMRHLGEDGPLTLDIDGELDNREGVILSAADIELSAGKLNNADGLLHAEGELSIEADSVDNQRGELATAGALRLDAEDRLDNSQGRILAEQDVEIAAGGLDNTVGLIGSIAGELTLDADTLDNTQGRLEAERDLTLDVAGTLRNAGGEIVQLGEGDMQLSARQLQGDEGLI
ncbi:filamentous hemagglutinin N-terminal domain-containing protein, partial [Billgrantia endophytica]